jgi:hypothetical protein
MERKTTKGLRWRKLGGGSLRYINGRIIKPNEVFTAELKDIPVAFLKSLECLDKDRLAEETVSEKEMIEAGETLYEKREKTAKGWFGVFRISDGKEMTETTLKEEAADAMVERLNKG